MKKLYFNVSTPILLFLSIFFFLSFSNLLVQAQTGNCTVLNHPCNNDGILAVEITSGLTPPLTFNYCDGVIVHSNINVMVDTAYGLNYEPYNNVIVTDNFGGWLYLWTGFQAPFSIDWANITHALCPDTLGTIEFTINGGAYPASVEYFSLAGTPYGIGNPMDLPVGSYQAFITDSNGCVREHSDSIYALSINQYSNIDFDITTTEASCTNGTATVTNITGGIQPYTYLWFNGLSLSSINNLSQGNYNVTVTDSIGCSTSKNVNITQNPNISAFFTTVPATCLQNDGSITAYGSSGVTPYTYLWENGSQTQTISGLSGGTSMWVIVTDANSCWRKAYKNLSNTTPITVNYSTTTSSCSSPTGSATLSITGGTLPYSVVWSTFPVQTGITASNLPSGTYHFEVTDSVGCVRTGNAIIPDEGNLSVNAYIDHATCNLSNGSITVNVSGNNPPFTYNWSNGGTTQIINNLQPGSYTCTITDNIGCFIIRTKTVQEISPIDLTFVTNPASCIYTADGSITVNIIGGTSPYTISWTGGQTTQTATNLMPGFYHCYVVDANNCSRIEHIYLNYDHNNDSCYCTLTGVVYVDDNSNCIYDAGEELVQNVNMHCDYFGHNFTDTAGVYSFIVPTGNYTLSEIVQNYYPLATCQNNLISVNATAASGCVITNNFANVINPLHDIRVTSSPYYAIPGNIYTQHVIVSNNGTITENDIQLGYAHDGQLPFLNSSIPFSQTSPISYPNWYSINSGFPTLEPTEHQSITVNYNVPTNIPLGTEVVFYDTVAYAQPISLWTTDYSPWNNVLLYPVTIKVSYDPNCKEVFPRGDGAEGFITTDDTTLTYTINFENTGNYYASKVVLVDTLDSNLDWISLQPGYSNHYYTADLSEDGILTFTFNDINLPWSSEAAKGYVSYSIRQNPSLAIGTIIENRASIFFDYNAPIVTNTVINTISEPVEVPEHIEANNLLVYPNPTSGILYFKNVDNAQITITDLTGRIVKKKNKVNKSIDINFLNPGLYIITIKQKENLVTTKIIKN